MVVGINIKKGDELMEFDIVIGNPPYQDNDGGGMGTSARPLYQEFVFRWTDIAHHLIMIIPARWYCGGKGLDDFRDFMLSQANLVEIYDILDEKSVFPNIKLPGGVCYFHINNLAANIKECKVVTADGVGYRDLKHQGMTVFIRNNRVYNILKKLARSSDRMNLIVTERNPYGLPSDVFEQADKYGLPKIENKERKVCDNNGARGLKVIGVVNNKREERFIGRDYPIKWNKAVDKYKVFISKAIMPKVLTTTLRPFIGYPGDICTETYLQIGCFDTLEEAESCISYIHTKIFHLGLLFRTTSQNITRQTFELIPLVKFDRIWTDDELSRVYELTDEEMRYIDEIIIRKYN